MCFFGNGDLRLSAGGEELCGNVIILENDIEHKAPDGEITFFLFAKLNLDDRILQLLKNIDDFKHLGDLVNASDCA